VSGFSQLLADIVFHETYPLTGNKATKVQAKDTYDADRGTEGLGRQVVAETSLDSTGATVGAGDAAPDAADLGAVDLALSAVDESDTLAEVELGVSSSLDTLDLNEGDVGALVALSALESKNTTFSVKTMIFL